MTRLDTLLFEDFIRLLTIKRKRSRKYKRRVVLRYSFVL